MKFLRLILFLFLFITLSILIVEQVNAAPGDEGDSCRAGVPRCDPGLECTTSFGPGTCFAPTPTPSGGGGGSCSADGASCSSGSQCCSGSCSASCYDTGYGEQCFCGTSGGGGGSTPTNTPPVSTPTRTPTPTNTPTPTPATYTISGKVFVDSNSNGVQNCSGACNNGSGDELNYSGATLTLQVVGPDPTTTTNASGNYSFASLSSGTYTVTLTVPSGYIVTNPPNGKQVTIGPNGTANFGIIQDPECADGVDNNSNSLIDTNDPGCHTNGDPTDPSSYDPTKDSEDPECADGVDNNSNGLIDSADPFCHTDGNASNPGSYSPTDNTEYAYPPICTGLSVNSSPVGAGLTASLSVTGCNSYQSPTYNWLAPSAGTTLPANGATPTYTAPSNICSNTNVTQDVQVSNGAGYNTYSTDITVTPRNVLSGAVYEDTAGNNCASGATPYTGGAGITVFNGGVSTGADTTDGSGAYSIADTTACGSKTAVISGISGYQVRAARFDNGAWSSSNLSGFTYGPFNFSANHTVDYCISSTEPWIQTTSGDVRTNSFTNKVPTNQYASTDASSPSVFYSSSFNANFGTGNASVVGWKVNDEYSYNDEAKNRNGNMSYSFYLSRLSQTSTQTQEIPGCVSDTCSTGISNLSTGAYRRAGDLDITSYTHQAGQRVLILVDGDATISTDISVPAGAMLIIAAKGDIIIASNVGTTTLSSTTTNINGVFTAHGSITVDGSSCSDGTTPDRRLNVAGALIANSLKPFTVGGAGSLVNNRSLCTQDQSYPSIYIAPRLDFVTQLTDFYKTSYTRWRELAP